MKKNRNVLAGLLSLVVLAVSACGSSNSATGNTTQSQMTETETTSEVVRETEVTEQSRAPLAASNGYLKMTLNGEQVVRAEMTSNEAAAEFLEQLPFTVTMHEHLNRQKEVYLPFSLSEESQQDTVYEYEIGDIVYWHPGPTMGIFTSHDGRSISSGVEILARLDDEGVAAFSSYPDDVEVLFEYEAAPERSQNSAQGERQLLITLNDTDTIHATLVDSPAANAFAKHLPLTLNMTDYLGREKHAGLSFSIDEADLLNIQTPYEIGDIIYYPPGPTFAMYYDHDGREISAGMEVIARLDEESIRALATYPDSVQVTVELGQ